MNAHPQRVAQPDRVSRAAPERTAWAEELAWLEQAGLAGPAYLLLQTLRPVSFLLGQGALFVQPLLPLNRWRRTAGRLAALLNDRAHVEAFLTVLEAHLHDQGRSQRKEAS